MSNAALVVTTAVDEAIRLHGQETYPHECCGALVGPGNNADNADSARRVTATVPVFSRR